jgi:ABC-2 type transport system permease protein
VFGSSKNGSKGKPVMLQAIEIAKLYLYSTFRERATFIFGFLMPLIFTFVLGTTLGNAFGGGDGGPQSWNLLVVNEDAGIYSTALLDNLQADDSLAITVTNRDDALAKVADNEVVGALIMPANFTQSIQENQPIALDLHISQNNVNEGQLIEQRVGANVNQLVGVLKIAGTSTTIASEIGLFASDDSGDKRTAYTASAQNRAEEAWQNPPILLEIQQATRIEDRQQDIPVGIGQSAPASIVIFSMFFMMAGTAALVQEREEGTLRRLLVMPIQKFTVIAGKFLGVYSSGLLQIFILVVCSALFFGVNWGQAPVALALIILSFAFAITSLSMLVAALVRSLAQANALPTIIILPMAALGGAMWPLEITPQWMQSIGHIFPTAWAMDGFNDIVTRGLGLSDVLLEIAVLLGFGILFLAIGVWGFKYE